jgi:RNA polymerase sigma-70 factor (family 1)
MKRYQTYSDQELLDLLKEGDQAAFTEIYDRYKEILHRYAYRWLQDRESVKDVIQELFTLVWTKHEILIFNQNLSGYLYTAVRNGILRKISQDRRAADYTDSLQQYADRGESITDHRLREKQLREIIEKEIDALPEKMREVFKMSRDQHLSHAEIAERLGLSEHTVRTHVKRALKILRSNLGIYLFLYFLIH